MLYMGYVGFSVAFSFAIAALARWPSRCHMGALVTAMDDGGMVFLTIGIALGSAWAYYTLGWGGWWFWDPVENASFMPWLTGTALIHSLGGDGKARRVQELDRAARDRCVFAVAARNFPGAVRRADLGARVRDRPARGVFILIFLAIVIGGSLALFACRAGRSARRHSGRSRAKSMLLANNILLIVAIASVLLGTLYPLFLDALNLGKISVGPPYFDAVFYPLMAPAAFLMGIGPMARWTRAPLPEICDAPPVGARRRGGDRVRAALAARHAGRC